MKLNITSGKKDKPLKIVVYGVESVGKTTFAANAPDALIIDLEQGSTNIDANRIEGINDYEGLINALREIYKESVDYKTIVIDSIEMVEKFCQEKITKDADVDSIEKVGGGYGKGYTASSELFFKVLGALNALWQKGYHIIVIGHAEIKTYINPEGTDYDRFKLRLDKRNEPVIKEWAEANLFMNFETFVEKDQGGFQKEKGKARSLGRRCLYTVRQAAYDAKNRYGLPDKILVGKDDPFNSFWKEFKK